MSFGHFPHEWGNPREGRRGIPLRLASLTASPLRFAKGEIPLSLLEHSPRTGKKGTKPILENLVHNPSLAAETPNNNQHPITVHHFNHSYHGSKLPLNAETPNNLRPIIRIIQKSVASWFKS